MDDEALMLLAVEEAKVSLREGNNGFGAVLAKDGQVIAAGHDCEDTQDDPTSHAELNVIRAASRVLGRKLTGCRMISTHEPCPMCAAAIVWADIPAVVYGYSIEDAFSQGRKRMNIGCAEIFARAGACVEIRKGVLKDDCAILYREEVRREIKRLRAADDAALCALNEDSTARRTAWFLEQGDRIRRRGDNDPLEAGYRLLLERFHISQEEAPVVFRTERQIGFHSMNFCPTLEACKILGLDTRYICKRINEDSTNRLLRLLDPRLRFSRNYEKLRPYLEYCEEMITLIPE